MTIFRYLCHEISFILYAIIKLGEPSISGGLFVKSLFGGRLSIISEYFIYLLAIVITIAIFVLNFQYTTFTYSSWYPLIFDNSFLSSLAKVIIALLLIILLGLFIKNLNRKYIIPLIVLINLVTFILRILIINGFNNFPVADSWHVFNGANVLFFTEDIRPLYIGNYFALYPQQLGIVTLLYPLALLFKENINAYYQAQVILIQVAILLLTISSYKLKGLKAAFITTLFLNLFIPNYFVSFLIYGDLYAMLFLTIAFVVFAYRDVFSSKPFLYYGLVLLCLSLAYLARLSTNVFVLAIIFTALISYRVSSKLFIRIALLMSTIILPFMLITNFFNVQDVELGKYAFPTNTWLRLGLGYSGFDEKTPGYHDIKTDIEFRNVGYDAQAMSKINQTVIDKQLRLFQDPDKALDFFKQKTIIMWTDPDFEMMTLIVPFKGSKIEDPRKTYQEINYGFGAIDLSVKTDFGNLLTENYYMIRKYEKVFMFSILILLLLSFLKAKKDDQVALYARLILIGFFLLHLLIEIKSRYVFVCVNALILYVSLYFTEYFDDVYLRISLVLKRLIKKEGIENDIK